MESANIIELAIAYYKDKVQQELIEKFRIESQLLLQVDADARRMKARENIMAMAQLINQLNKFRYTYSCLSRSCGKIAAIDDYINDIETQIKKLSYQKKHPV